MTTDQEDLKSQVEDLLQLLHSWHFLWNEGELTFEPFQYTQEGFDELVAGTRHWLYRVENPAP